MGNETTGKIMPIYSDMLLNSDEPRVLILPASVDKAIIVTTKGNKRLDEVLEELEHSGGTIKSIELNGDSVEIDEEGNVDLGNLLSGESLKTINGENLIGDTNISLVDAIFGKYDTTGSQTGFFIPSSESTEESWTIVESPSIHTLYIDVYNKALYRYTGNQYNIVIDYATKSDLNSKANASEVVKSISVNGTQQQKDSSGNVDISVAAEVSLDDVFGKVWYDSTNKKIKFYSKDATFNNGVPAQDTVAIAELNAADFIKDGMVHSVEVKDADVDGETVQCVVITFNTDAEQEDINIPVSEIFDTSLYYKKSETYNKTETDTALGNKVDAVALNGNVLSYTKHGQSTNVATFKQINGESLVGNGSISIPAGTTPHIDAVSGNWFIGTVDTGVHAQGAKGDSGVASADGVRVVNDLNGDPADLQQGQVAVLSANMGKELSMGILAGKGNFADANLAASDNPSKVFPWMLVDVDSNNQIIKKMIWHTGNGAFVDAIGAVISGNKYGVTITSSSDGVLKFKKASSETTASELPFTAGETNYTFREIEEVWRDTNNDTTTEYNGKSFTVTAITTSETSPSTLDIDFGGATVYGIDSSSSIYLKLTSILNAKINLAWSSFGHGNAASTSKLKHVSLSGGTASNGYRNFKDCKNLRTLDLSKVSGSVSSMAEFLAISNHYIKTIDIRGFDTRSVAGFSDMCRGLDAMTTLIIGNFSTHSATNINLMFAQANGNAKTNLTLVCTTDTPPEIKQGYSYLDSFSTIKVPNKTIEVEGVQTTVLAQYQAAAVWSEHSNKMSTYEDGEY